MKKFFTVCAVMVAAMTLSAQTPIVKTCEQAAAIALALEKNNTPTEEIYSITGYVTNVVSAVSKGQQSFWIDDVKGNKKTFQSYYCNLPKDDQNTLNVGDKVKLVGPIMKYGTTAEMKNGDVTIIDRILVKRETLSVTTCEAYAECSSMADGDASIDIFIVRDMVVSVDDANTTYGWQNITFKCDDNKNLIGYHIDFGGEEKFCAVGDSVEVTGTLKNFGGKMEIEGKGVITKKGDVKVDTIPVGVAEALQAGLKLEKNITSKDVYEVTGYVDSIAYAFSATNKNMSFFMCDDMANPTYTFEAYKVSTDVDIPVGTKVKVTGPIKHYFNTSTETSLIEVVNGKAEILAHTDIEDIELNRTDVQKVMMDGQLYIIREGSIYTTAGVQVK